jgi:sodium transport system permease protein
MKLSNVAIIYRKELKDILRDRKTLISMFLFPLILFPLMTVGFNRFEQRMRERAKQDTARIMILGAEHAPELAGRIRAAESLEIVATAADYAQQISDKRIRAAVEFPAGLEGALSAATTPAEPPQVKIYYYQTETRSEGAVERIEELVSNYRHEVVGRRLQSQGMSRAAVDPIEIQQENVAAEEKVAGSRFAVILPYFIVFLCFMGAMGPAMDLTAGEKERGTLETILASAVGRDDLVLGKFLLVLTTSLVTAVMSLASYTFTMRFSASYVQQMTAGRNFTISPQALLSVFLVVLPMAILFSAALFAVALLAKNFKEAQNYTGPLMFVVILPAMAGMLPGVELNAGLAMVPILNVSLAAKELLTGSFPLGHLAIVFASTSVFAAIALLAAFRMFQTESVLFRS